MCAFVDADAALQAARTMHVRVLEQTALGGPALGIHVGCHYGAVIEDAGDLYGDCVNAAARVVGLAKVGQVIATQEVVARLGGPARDKVRMLDRVTVKGKREPLEIYEFAWQDSEEITTLGTRFREERVPRLRLVYGDRELWFDGAGSGHDRARPRRDLRHRRRRPARLAPAREHREAPGQVRASSTTARTAPSWRSPARPSSTCDARS